MTNKKIKLTIYNSVQQMFLSNNSLLIKLIYKNLNQK